MRKQITYTPPYTVTEHAATVGDIREALDHFDDEAEVHLLDEFGDTVPVRFICRLDRNDFGLGVGQPEDNAHAILPGWGNLTREEYAEKVVSLSDQQILRLLGYCNIGGPGHDSAAQALANELSRRYELAGHITEFG